jgi:DNA polymerase-3 subunit gamma/tau
VPSETAAAKPSPFERDRSRKSGEPELSAGAVAVQVAEAASPTGSQTSEASVAQLREAVLASLENGGHRMAASTLEGGHWQLNANELFVQAAASPSLIEMAMTTDAKRLAGAAATTAAGRNIRLRIEGNGNGNGSAPAANNPPRAATGGRQRATEDPIVKRVQEKFGAEIRTVIDYREKQR